MTSTVEYIGELRTTCTHLRSGSSFETDAPVDNNGKGERFSPTDLTATSLGTCMATVMGIKARQMGFDLNGLKVEVEKIMGASGLSKGWDELEVNPGAFVKTSLRFDFGRFNETVKAVEIGMSLEAYSKEILQLARVEKKRLFFQGHVAILFGRRK